ncbi:MAG TPA: hypothetical protein VFI31_15545 [Pirellulales bacterium]|nr:hypothetical protein [Pirellulales bacterium]
MSVASHVQSHEGPDTRTFWSFLRGDNEAILRLASADRMLGIGLLFVLSAALAREYDGVDLLAEPWHFVLPLAASLGTSFVLFCLLFGVGKARRMDHVPFGRAYLRFLTLYWMTAPLAWLYALPVESVFGPIEATMSNLVLLGVVAAWRVFLMTRAVETLFGAGAFAAWSVVLLFADLVALAALAFVPKPVVSIMGGISHTDAEIAIFNVTFMVGIACVVSLPVWLLATAVVIRHGGRWKFALSDARPTTRPSLGLRLFAVASVAVWIVVLPLTQPKQQLARRVNEDLKSGRIWEAVAEMSTHQRNDFPARWEPPPHIGYGEREPPILDIIEAVLASDAPDWVRSVFTEKFGNTLYDTRLLSPDEIDDEELGRYVRVLLRLPQGPSFASRKEGFIQLAYEQAKMSPRRQADLKALLDLAKTYDPTRHPDGNFARSY